MSFLRPIQWYPSRADPIWPYDTLNFVYFFFLVFPSMLLLRYWKWFHGSVNTTTAIEPLSSTFHIFFRHFSSSLDAGLWGFYSIFVIVTWKLRDFIPVFFINIVFFVKAPLSWFNRYHILPPCSLRQKEYLAFLDLSWSYRRQYHRLECYVRKRWWYLLLLAVYRSK